MKKFCRLSLLYVISDIIVSFGVTLLGFLSFYGTSGLSAHLVPALIYCASVSAGTVISFWIFKVYKIIVRDFGLFETIRIMIVVFVINLVGFVTLVLVPSLPHFSEFVFTWVLEGGVL